MGWARYRSRGGDLTVVSTLITFERHRKQCSLDRRPARWPAGSFTRRARSPGRASGRESSGCRARSVVAHPTVSGFPQQLGRERIGHMLRIEALDTSCSVSRPRPDREGRGTRAPKRHGRH